MLTNIPIKDDEFTNKSLRIYQNRLTKPSLEDYGYIIMESSIHQYRLMDPTIYTYESINIDIMIEKHGLLNHKA